MKLVDKTLTTVIIEATMNEVKDKGFDRIWDDIREIYKVDDYELDNIRHTHDKKLILITMKSLKYFNILEN